MQKNPFDTIKGSIEGAGGLGRIEGVWETQFQTGDAAESRVIYAVDVEISGPMASMVGGFMEQVADSLVKQGLESFNQAITGAKADVASQTNQKKEALPQASLIRMIFRSVFDVIIKKIRKLFK